MLRTTSPSSAPSGMFIRTAEVYAGLMSGRDRGEPSAREIQAAMERATQVDTFSGDRRGEVQAAMRDVGYGGPNWT
jgi:hypothetical protein